MAVILNHPRVYSFLHVPVQSASDSVLMDMRREYCLQDFKRVVDFLRERVPDITILTDFICGFPTETEKDFEESLKLIEEYKFPSLFINQFFPRPGTPAARMQRVPPPIVKRRTKRMSELFKSYTTYDHKVGDVQRVLATELSFDQQYYVAHNKSYDQVLVPKDAELMGKMFDVEITESGKHYLKCRLATGTIVSRPESVPPPLKQGEVSGLTSSTNVLAPQWCVWLLAAALVALVARVLYITAVNG